MEKMLYTMENMDSNEHLTNFSVYTLSKGYTPVSPVLTGKSCQRLPRHFVGILPPIEMQ